MVLNEAVTAGLPVIATEASGGAWDLVDDGANGFRVPTGDVVALSTALRRTLDDPAFRESASKQSLEIAGGFTPTGWAAAVAAACSRVLG